MSKKGAENFIKFLDDAGPKIDTALRTHDRAEFNRVMDGLLEDLLKVDFGDRKRKAPVRRKPKVRRGIGSY